MNWKKHILGALIGTLTTSPALAETWQISGMAEPASGSADTVRLLITVSDENGESVSNLNPGDFSAYYAVPGTFTQFYPGQMLVGPGTTFLSFGNGNYVLYMKTSRTQHSAALVKGVSLRITKHSQVADQIGEPPRLMTDQKSAVFLKNYVGG